MHQTVRIALRPIELRDHEILGELRADTDLQHLLLAYPSPYTKDDVDTWIERRDSQGKLWAIDVGGECLGFVQLSNIHNKGRFAWLGLALIKGGRGRGIGEQAMKGLEQKALGLNLRKLLLEVRSDNASAIRLYQSLGYRLVGRLEGHYDDGVRLLDTLIMEKMLGSA